MNEKQLLFPRTPSKDNIINDLVDIYNLEATKVHSYTTKIAAAHSMQNRQFQKLSNITSDGLAICASSTNFAHGPKDKQKFSLQIFK